MKMKEAFWASILLSETHNPEREKRGVLAGAAARVGDQGYYEGIEITYVDYPEDRKRMGDLARANKWVVTYWNAPLLDAEKLDLASLEEPLRRKSVTRMKDHIEFAAESYVRNFGLMAGREPGPAKRAEATERVYDSLCELAEYAQKFPPMRIVIEPFDREAHKKGLIGPTNEAAALIRRLRQHYPESGLSWDSSHAALNDEDLMQSLTTGQREIVHMHIANPVVDKTRPDYGDYHIALGPPGLLRMETVAEIFRQALSLGIIGKQRLGVGVEYRTQPGGDPWATEAVGRNILETAWKLATEAKA